MIKCEVNDEGVEPCSALRRASDQGKGKGLFKQLRMDDSPRVVFAIRSGEFKQRGVCVNFCPFCGISHIGAMTGS